VKDWQSKLKAMQKGGTILREVLTDLMKHVQVGRTTREIDQIATELIKKGGGEISFNKVPGYKWATCLSVNEVVVHGVPSEYVIQSGDVVKVDIGVYYGGYHVDYSDTVVAGRSTATNKKTNQFLQKGRDTLRQALSLVKPGNTVGDVSLYIDRSIHDAHYKVIQDLTGHAVGEELHMDPLIPGVYLDNTLMREPFVPGNAYAVEVIYSMNDSRIEEANNDGWSLKTKKGSQSACFENSVFVTEREGIVLI